MNWPAYPEYKDSSVDGMKAIPSDWDVVRMDKFIRYEKDQVDPTFLSGQEVFHYSIPEVQQTGDGAVEDGGTIDSNKLLINRPVLLVSKLNPRKGTVCGARPHGLTTVCSTEFVPLVTQGVEQDFLQYLVTSDLYRQRLESLVESATRSHQRVQPSDIFRFWWAVPSLMEQSAIAGFLDRETGKIDALIDKQQQLITTLREDRTATITHAVTKGLNPDVEMKDSGIEWLGAVPVYWDVRQLKWGSPVRRGASPRPIDDPKYFDDEGEWSWVRISDVSASDGQLHETSQKLSELGSSLSVRLNPGALFISIAGTVGKPCITRIPICIHDGFVYFPTIDISTEYLYRIFEAGECYRGLGKMGTQLNLNTDTIGSIRLPFPPKGEQIEITDFLRSKCGNIDALIAKATDLVAKIQEYRSALVTAAVTGKIDVREAA